MQSHNQYCRGSIYIYHGTEVDVIVIVETATKKKQSLRSIIGTGKGYKEISVLR